MNQNIKQSFFLQKKIAMIFLLLFGTMGLFNPSVSLANDENTIDLLIPAIIQNDTVQITTLLKKVTDFNNPKIFIRLSEMPPNIVELLFNNNHKKVDPNLYCQNLKDQSMLVDEGLMPITNTMAYDPQKTLETEAKNLHTKASQHQRIPRILHHVWVTNDKTKREISDEDIQYVLNTNKIFSQSGEREEHIFTTDDAICQQRWEHIVWTNNKKLIPISVKKLESQGIKVREITEIEHNLKLNKKIEELIEQGLWGMASDILRIEIVRCLGGVYSDLNYVFSRNVEEDIYKYDFFAIGIDSTIDEQAFGSAAHHPILEEAVNLAGRKLDAKQRIIATLGLSGKEVTYFLTGDPLSIPYHQHANKNGTTDIVYQISGGATGLDETEKNHETSLVIKKYVGSTCAQEITRLEKIQKMVEFIKNNGACSPQDLIFGYDTTANSWTK